MDSVQLPIFAGKLLELTQNSFPTNALIETTHRCRADCSYCFLSDKHCAPELDTEHLTAVVRKLDADGIVYLTLTGGDPFIRSDILRVFETTFSLNFFGIALFTSGYLLDDNHLTFLENVQKQVSFLQMTVFSHKEEVHDRYACVDGGLKKILSAGHKLLSKGIRVQIALPVMEFNLSTIDDTIVFLENEGFRVIHSVSKLITPENCSPDLIHEISPEFFRRFFQTIPPQKLSHLYARYEKSCSPAADDESLCQGLRQTVTIDNCGELRPCVAFRDVSFGSYLNDIPLHTLLSENETYQHLISLNKNDLKCGSCHHRKFCNPCIGRWHSYSGSFVQPDEQACNFADSFINHLRETICAPTK